MESNAKRIVIVEDDDRLADLTKTFLTQHEYDVSIINNGRQAIDSLPSKSFDLVILDLMLPGADGIEVCKKIRGYFCGPILMLTAKKSDFDQIIGLEVGADDYVIKPIEPNVLLARIRALLRRNTEHSILDNSPNDTLIFGGLEIKEHSHKVVLNDVEIPLTTREFQLLWILASNAGKIVSREEIFHQTRGLEYDGMDRTVDVRISKLRKKLNDNTENPFRLKTIWGKGYLFVPDAWVE
ncbi:response regulator [Pleionea sediminis]|uniref:response regulator n=1 Tax=Pleionea sediminis TaxID=2569479 RepID=UPI0013DDCB0A|nr:response regulator [Pleionea sediminis]